MDEVRGLQERVAGALPAEHVEQVAGWWLRNSPGCAWWVQTVLPHAEAPAAELARLVAEAEAFYADRGAPARFQITPGACPAALDRMLADRGHRRFSPMSLRTAATADVRARTPATLRTRIDEHPSRAWFEVWNRVHGGEPGAERNLLARVQRPSGYVCALLDDEVVGVGRVVADTGRAGVFGMATLPRARGRGAAATVLAAAADWATGRADRMYLQVAAEHSAAMRLYRRAGFAEASRYHYRGA